MKITSFRIAVMTLCALLAFVPAGASDFTLGIFGNANMDDTIDELDIEYVQGIINGINEPTQFADANYDGVIDENDIEQIKLVISSEEKKLTLIDDSGKIVTVTKPVEKIIPIYMADSVRVLGANDMVVGVEESINNQPEYYPVLSQKPSVGTVSPEINIERIIRLDPDLVIASVYTSPDILDDHLKGTNIQVVRIYPRNEDALGDVKTGLHMFRGNEIMWPSLVEDMLKLGYVLNKVDTAKEYVEWYYSIVTPIEERISHIQEDERPKIYTEDDSRGGTIERQTSAHIMGTLTAGGNRIGPGTFDLAADRIISVEWLIAQNPDVIVARIGSGSSTGGYKSSENTDYREYYNEIMGLPGIKQINAVKNNRVHIICDHISYRTALPIGIAYQAKWYYPELFADLDPQALHQEYIDRFCSELEFDVHEDGVFVYPPL
jgi:iron complex transport system substrate-binding protein